MQFMIVAVSLFFFGVASSSTCPGGCTCKNNKQDLKCHFPAARSIPQNILPKNVTKLDLSGNNILNIPPGSLKSIPKVEEFLLDRNKVYFLENGAFKGLSALSTISIEDSNLHFIEDEVFSPLANLEELNLTKNELEKFPNLHKNTKLSRLSLSQNKLKAIPGNALKENSLLKEIHLGSNELTELDRNVFPLDVSNITTLDLVKNRLTNTPDVVKEMTALEDLLLCYNPIKIFHSEDFRPLTSLKILMLVSVGMDEFPENLFWLPQLEYLDISKNQINSNSLENIKFPSLTTLKMNNNPIGVIGSESFRYIPKMENLLAASCGISGIHDKAFVYLQQLKKLDLRDNNLGSVPRLQENRNLEEIILDNNSIQSLSLASFRSMENLKILSITNNSLSRLDVSSFFPPSRMLSLSSINLSGNNLTSLPPSEILELMPQLTSLDISSNLLFDNFSTKSLSNLKNISMLNLKKNSIDRIVSDAENPLWSLRNLYMCGNNLTELDMESLAK